MMRKIYSADGLGVGRSNPAWSPDGKQIALVDRDYLILINLDDLSINKHKLNTFNNVNVGLPFYLAWSKAGDDERLVFTNQNEGTLCIIRPTNFILRYLDQGGMPSWSPIGDEIACLKGGGLCTMPRYGGTPVLLAQNNHHRIPATWSPSGKYIAFVGPSNGILVVNRRTSEIKQLVQGEWYGWGDCISWSTIDEDLIAVTQFADISRMFLLKTDGTLVGQLDNFGQGSWSLGAWSFNGRKLIGWEKNNVSDRPIVVIDVDSGRREVIGIGNWAVWSPIDYRVCVVNDKEIFVTDV